MDHYEPRYFTWKEAPMVRLLLPLTAGIVGGIYIQGMVSVGLAAGGMVVGLLGCTMLTRRRIPYQWRFGYALCCFCFWLGAGIWLSQQHLSFNRPDYFLSINAQNPVWEGTVSGKNTVDITGYWEREGEEFLPYAPVSGKLLVYAEAPLEKGLIILFQGAIQDIQGAKNPEGFDNKRYRFFQNIHCQTYLGDDQYIIVGQKKPSAMERWRSKQIDIWRSQISDTEVFSIAAAMVLGYKDELSRELRSTYAQTGASHVLAVSGLHVGLIYLLLNSLLGRIRQGRYLRLVNTLMCLAGIWGFAFLTGATPSVIRASTMFSFMLVGKQLRWSISIFNSLAASAFLLLCIHPLWLFHIGFQLSYLAVLGIVVFQPRWYHLWIPGNKWADKVWTLITVSLAAQLATLPLTLFYFHQFPAYFWLSGLIVVPAAPFIIGLGILMTLFQYVLPQLVWLPATLLKELIHIINRVLQAIQELPFSVWENIYLPGESIVLSFVALFLLAWVWDHRNRKHAIWYILLLNAIAGIRCYYEARDYCREELVVYQVTGETLIDYMYRGNLLTWKSDGLGEEAEERAAAVYRKRRRVSKQQIWERGSPDGYMVWGNMRLWVVGQGRPNAPPTLPDFILLSGNPRIQLAELADTGAPIIADASNWKKKRDAWREESQAKGWNFVDVRETGAYIVTKRRGFFPEPALPSEKNPVSD